MSELGRSQYEVYGASVGWKNFQGNPMPTWEALPDTIRSAWAAVARASERRLSADAVERWLNEFDMRTLWSMTGAIRANTNLYVPSGEGGVLTRGDLISILMHHWITVTDWQDESPPDIELRYRDDGTVAVTDRTGAHDPDADLDMIEYHLPRRLVDELLLPEDDAGPSS